MQGSFNERERVSRQLEAIEGRFEELSIRITLPEVISDTALFTKLMREHSELSPLNDIAVKFRSMERQLAEAQEMLEDPDMAEMAREELAELEPAFEAMIKEAHLALLPKDPDDRRNAIRRRGRAFRRGTSAHVSALRPGTGLGFQAHRGRLHGAGRHKGIRCHDPGQKRV